MYKISIMSVCFITVFASIVSSVAWGGVTYKEYEAAVSDNNKVSIKGISRGDGIDLDGRLYKPKGDGPFPALVALHGAGGIFPYQLWWAKKISKMGFVVLFVDHYCTRDFLCEHATDDSDERRGEIMRDWQQVDIKQRAMDAAAAYKALISKPYVHKDKIGLIGWSWGGSSALFVQKIASRLSLPHGGFKGTIAFYPNLTWYINKPQWKRTGQFVQPIIILYGNDDELENEEAYQELLAEDHPGPIKVIGFKGATRKFDELGGYRSKYHPSVGYFGKAFHKPSFEGALLEVTNFLNKYFR